jgi:hypothetical protein
MPCGAEALVVVFDTDGVQLSDGGPFDVELVHASA